LLLNLGKPQTQLLLVLTLALRLEQLALQVEDHREQALVLVLEDERCLAQDLGVFLIFEAQHVCLDVRDRLAIQGTEEKNYAGALGCSNENGGGLSVTLPTSSLPSSNRDNSVIVMRSVPSFAWTQGAANLPFSKRFA